MNKKVLSFLIIGLLIYSFDYFFNRGEDENTIIIYDDDVKALIQRWNEQVGRPPREDDIRGIIDQLVNEEVLYREAVKLGLDKNDIIIKRRLAQKLTFLRDSLESNTPEDDLLEAFYENNKKTYFIEELYTFSQVYFSSKEGSEDEAKASLFNIKSGSDPTGGEPFMLGKNFVNRTKKEITRDFGQNFTNSLIQNSIGRWQGPIKSSYGNHLVSLINVTEPKQLSFNEAKSIVLADFLAAQKKKDQEDYLNSLRKKYKIVIDSEI